MAPEDFWLTPLGLLLDLLECHKQYKGLSQVRSDDSAWLEKFFPDDD
jgi:hypothetical protein